MIEDSKLLFDTHIENVVTEPSRALEHLKILKTLKYYIVLLSVDIVLSIFHYQKINIEKV